MLFVFVLQPLSVLEYLESLPAICNLTLRGDNQTPTFFSSCAKEKVELKKKSYYPFISPTHIRHTHTPPQPPPPPSHTHNNHSASRTTTPSLPSTCTPPLLSLFESQNGNLQPPSPSGVATHNLKRCLLGCGGGKSS